LAEITVDTTRKTLIIHDGTTAGGTPLSTLSFAQAAYDAANAEPDASPASRSAFATTLQCSAERGFCSAFKRAEERLTAAAGQ
jgi:hypothetical protein